MDSKGAPTQCKCGNMTARWLDPQRGTVRVKALDKSAVRFIGLNNSFLSQTLFAPDMTHHEWRDLHAITCNQASGYLFHEGHRNCWAVLIKVGDSNDIAWEEESVKSV